MRSHAKAPSAGSNTHRATGLRRHSIAFACVLALLACAGIGASSAGAASRVALSTFGEGPIGSPGGFEGLRGLAVNTTGAGGVPAGTLYAADNFRNRVERLSSSGVFERAWGLGVAAGSAAGTANLTSVSGTGTLALNSTSVTSVSGSFANGQTISGPGIPPGTTIQSGGGTSTLTISKPATKSTVAASLRAGEVTSVTATSHFFVQGETITGSTGIPAGTTVVKVETSPTLASSKLVLSNAVTATATGANLTATADPGDVATNEVQYVNVPAVATGTYKLKYKTISPTVEAETATISVSAPASGAGSVQEALENLTNVGAGNVSVTEAAASSRVYAIEFKGRFADTNVEPLTIPSQPTGATATVITHLEGGAAFETCTESCAIGLSITTGEVTQATPAAIKEPNGLAVDQGTGNVYVADKGNARIDVYSAAGAFEGAFGWDVINGGAAGTGTIAAGSNEVTTVTTTAKAFAVGQTITDSEGGIPAGTKITAVTTGVGAASKLTLSKGATLSKAGDTLTVSAGAGNVAGNEIQTISYPSTDTGTYKLKLKTTMPTAEPETATIPVGAPATGAGSVQEALANLANVGSGNVAVSGPVTAAGKTTYTVEFTGTRFADTNVEAIGVAVQPTGAGLAVATTRNGNALELCTTASGCQAGTVGADAGAFSNLNQATPVVDPTTGDLYVPDQGNLRINEFRPTLNGSGQVIGVSFVRAFGWDVAPGAVNEQQEIRVNATGGKFTLSLGSGGPGVSETGEISATAGASAVEAALNAITNVSTGGGSVTVSGGPGDAGATKPYVVTFGGGPLAGANVEQLVATGAGAGNALSGGSPSSGASVRTLANGHAATAGLEDCVEASGCKAGVGSNTEGAVQFALKSPGSIAADFEGNVYSANLSIGEGGQSCGGASAGNCQILKFGPDGESVSRFGPSTGDCRLNYTKGSESLKEEGVAALDVATNPDPAAHDNHVFFLKKTSTTTYKVYELDPADESCSISPEGVNLTGNALVTNSALAVGTEEHVYANQFSGALAKVYLLGSEPPASAKMVSAEASGPGLASFVGEVAAPAELEGQTFDTTWRFEYSTDQEEWTRIPVPDEDAGSEPSVWKKVEENDVSGLKPNTKYFVRVCATTSSPTCSAALKFTTQTQAPTVGETYAEAATQTEATLAAQVNPNSLPSTYHFEWATDQHWQDAHAYDRRMPAFERNLGGGNSAVIAQDTISGLEPASVYHFRVVASNHCDLAHPSTLCETTGPDQELETLNHCGLPNNRCYELVSPPDKGPAGVITTLYATGGPQVAPDGNSVVFPYLNPDEATAGGGLMYLGKRSETGWSSSQLNPPSLVPVSRSTSLGSVLAPGQVLFNSPDLSCSIVASLSPLTDDVPGADSEYGLRNLFGRDAAGKYRLITTPVPSSPSVVAGLIAPEYSVSGATPDCRRVYFRADYQYLPGTPSGLYESDNGVVRDAGILPDGSAPLGGHLVQGGGGVVYVASASANAVSEDGTKLFFTAPSDEAATNGKQAIFMRKDGAPPSIEVTKKQGGVNDSLGSRFALASKDGSHVFFISSYGLTPISSPGAAVACNSFTAGEAKACDLYDYNTSTGTLSDLSASANGAAVQRVLATSEEGKRVYFTAMGQLVPNKGKTLAENTANATLSNRTVNVYLSDNGSLSYVMTAGVNSLNSATTTTTPDGGYLLFTASENVTGSESGGKSQAYLYSSASKEIQCVSCRRDGQPASGLPSSLEGSSGQFVSDDGSRIFFVSRDALAPGAAQGKLNIYEWEHGQVFLLVAGQGKETSTGQEELYGASPSGDDVFLGTIVQLDPHDVDTVADLYDVRVGGGFAPPPTPPTPCDPFADQCQGPPAPPPATPSPVSGTLGPGNQPKSSSPPTRCRKGTVRRHGRCIKPRKHKRAPAHKRATHTDRGGVR